MKKGSRRPRKPPIEKAQPKQAIHRRSMHPRNAAQEEVIRTFCENDISLVTGPAGTGKTFLAVGYAVSQLLSGDVKKIILSRPLVSAGGTEKIGALPGDIREKLTPYLIPLYDELHYFCGHSEIVAWENSKEIEILPLDFARGRTLKNCIAILDEAQNATMAQLKMFLTRLGEGSKLIIVGDSQQSDLYRDLRGGLERCIEKLSGLNGIGIVQMDVQDIVRHKLITSIINRIGTE